LGNTHVSAVHLVTVIDSASTTQSGGGGGNYSQEAEDNDSSEEQHASNFFLGRMFLKKIKTKQQVQQEKEHNKCKK
jgi:hypothetical protein